MSQVTPITKHQVDKDCHHDKTVIKWYTWLVDRWDKNLKKTKIHGQANPYFCNNCKRWPLDLSNHCWGLQFCHSNHHFWFYHDFYRHAHTSIVTCTYVIGTNNNCKAITLMWQQRYRTRATSKHTDSLLTQTTMYSLLIDISCFTAQLESMFGNLVVGQIRSHNEHCVLTLHCLTFAVC